MITEQDLQEAIAECNGQRNPNASTCIKLAAFLTIKRELFGKDDLDETPPAYSFAAPPEYQSDTEFWRECQRTGADKLMPIMDELMTTLQVLYPRLYEGVMIKIADR